LHLSFCPEQLSIEIFHQSFAYKSLQIHFASISLPQHDDGVSGAPAGYERMAFAK
jgi:hypothetical protein